MHIKLDGGFCFAEAPWLSWKDIEYGLKNDFMTAKEVVEYTVRKLSSESSAEHYTLACLEGEDEFHVQESVSCLAGRELSGEVGSERVWVYLVFLWVFVNKDKFQDPLAVIEELYADFDYPDFIAPAVRYMPAEDSSLQGDDQLLVKLSNILDVYGRELRSNRSG
ncbi:DUF2247 family protein [Pseudomonas sp. UBA6562]|uniref:DUF2247 family protein n=1 Tax=Pseudomonas sp. UBA6562 TaxID=1947332 RepID=UPI0025D90720|nr:DUF2247 family protein [Pseudomonas sp. UBA6562]